MPPHNRAQNAAAWRTDELLLILLRQFKRLLAERGIDLTDADLKTMAEAAAERHAAADSVVRTRAALVALIADSEAVLSGIGLTYAQSLATAMTDLEGWETTADFLSLANDKGNAELRISSGAALLALLGDPRHAAVLVACWRHGSADPEDVDAVIAKRALAFAAHIPADARDFDAQLSAWAANYT